MRQLVIILMLCLGSGLPQVGGAATPMSRGDRSDATQAALGVRGDGKVLQESGGGPVAARALSPEMMGQTIRLYLEEEWGAQVKEVEVAVLAPSDSIELPAGKMESRVVPARGGEGIGRRLFHVAVTVSGKPWKTIEVYADVTAMVEALALSRSFRPDEVIDSLDLKTVRVRISQLTHPFMTDQEEIIGKSTARQVPADVPLRKAFLKAPVVMKKGDRVMIEAKRGGLSIQTYGVAKSNGYVGQTIMVANPDSGRELRGKVVAPGLVEVEF